jgi:hypothetical protein
MIAGLSGSLLSHDALERLLRDPVRPNAPLVPPGSAGRHLRAWHADIRARLGPSSGPRSVFDLVGEPLAHALGFTVVSLSGAASTVDALLQSSGVPVAVMIVSAWGPVQPGLWRHAVHRGLAHGARWCLCVTGPAVRVVDVERAHARRYAEFDLSLTFEDESAFAIFWGLLSGAALTPDRNGAVLDKVVALCEQHRAEVRISLREGVQDALLSLVGGFRAVSKRPGNAQLLNESLIVVYRILFLLFAEARSLVPTWHPTYRDGYTVETLRQQLDRAIVPTGLWETLQAIARLAHHGCHAGALRVPPFNGRLFSPADAPLADTAPLDDRIVGQALVALTTRKGKEGRDRISYADLGVEQLGAVYEHLLDYDLAQGPRHGPAVLVPTGRRKATGSFYTPRSLTEFLVRRTLAPAVQGATPERILELRVVDPAMGSGAFLVAACRYLASAYEQALIQEGSLTASDIGDDDRAGFRRAVAQRCLFGVDVNPMAVQLGRLSLWLATLSADKPLTFLDHHLRVGNSLVGGSIEDIVRQPAPGGRSFKARTLPLFADDELQSSLEFAIGARLVIARTPDDTLEQVRTKERALAGLNRADAPLARWRTAADLWCAAWYDRGVQAPGRATFHALLDEVVRDAGALPRHVADPWLARARATAANERFFHWVFEFPEVFHDGRGVRLAAGGFDAVIANPPWEMLRDEPGFARSGELSSFVRGSGVYRVQGQGHANLYQLFLERALELLKKDGRAGMILPSGFATDHSCAPLRRLALNRTSIDTFTTLENRDGIFPIHRGLKFLLMTLTNAGSTTELPARPGLRSADALDHIPDVGAGAGTLPLSRALIERISGDSLAVPEVRAPIDLEIVSTVSFQVPASGAPDGWNIRFGRELNATDDRPHFSESGEGLPIVEGKQIAPFHVDTSTSRYRIPSSTAGKLLDPERTFRRARLAYREVASATNRLTLIAAIVPAGVATTHTVFCLKDDLDERTQVFLCGMFNSYVANYLVRMRVGTHVTAAIVARLPLPKPTARHPVFRQIVGLSKALAGTFDPSAFARLNALVAVLYGLSPVQFAHVLDTFPLIPTTERTAAMRMFAAQKV